MADLIINFYPDSDKEEFIRAVQEYTSIWFKEGKNYKAIIEKISGLRFKESYINAIIFEGVSYSNPLSLRASYEFEIKKATLIHELVHRLTVGNKIKLSWEHESNSSLEAHKFIFLILFDIWKELFGEETAYKFVEVEKSRTDTYKEAWDWAIKNSQDQRQNLFKEIIKTGIIPE